jgi:hypothetical protein
MAKRLDDSLPLNSQSIIAVVVPGRELKASVHFEPGMILLHVRAKVPSSACAGRVSATVLLKYMLSCQVMALDKSIRFSALQRLFSCNPLAMNVLLVLSALVSPSALRSLS